MGAAGIDVAEGKAPHIDNRLNRLDDASSEFDLTYLTEQRGVHKKLISVYTMEARSGEKEPLAPTPKPAGRCSPRTPRRSSGWKGSLPRSARRPGVEPGQRRGSASGPAQLSLIIAA